MTPDRWQQICDLLHGAMQLEPRERPSYLDRHCSNDPDLRKEVNDLFLAEQDVRTDFLESPPGAKTAFDNLEIFEAIDRESGLETSPLIGRRLGSYQIVEEIGSGGMGEVYRAFRADDQYRKQVAIKVARQGRNSEAVIKRFKNERQILADLDHPNIARLLDGGTTEAGDPFFVMEFIEGSPIDEYCDHQKLTISHRLELFCQVCSAVQYAHRHLIVHRDIKPSNILVTADGTPKLLDFGIAKILDTPAIGGQLQATRTVFRPLTPGYASPEQVLGQTITTASDIYSLGVFLYELLSGRSPYRLTTYATHEIARAVCEVEPEKLSTAVRRPEPTKERDQSVAISPTEVAEVRGSSPEKLCRRLDGDLDNIVLMALRKEPQRRYESVEQFAQDIQRHLSSLPVLARKDTLGYRTGKFVNRHKFTVIAASVMALTLLTALGVTIRANRIARNQAEIARTQRARAEQRFNDVRKLANTMIFDLPKPIHGLPGSVAVEKMLYDNGLKYLDSLAAQSEGDVSLQRELAAGYKQLGDSMGNPYGGNHLGDLAGALANYRKALQMREKIAKSNPNDIQDQLDLAKNYRTVGWLLYKAGDVSGARKDVHMALEIVKPIAEAHNDNVKALNELAVNLLTLAGIEGERWDNGFIGQPAVALTYDLESVKITQKVAEMRPNEKLWQEQTAFMFGVISSDYLAEGKPNEAINYARQALQISNRLKATNAAEAAGIAAQRAARHSTLGQALLFSGRWNEALSEFKNELSLFKKVFDPQDFSSRCDLAIAYMDSGHGEALAGDATSGLRDIRKSLDVLGPSTTMVSTIAQASQAYMYEGDALEQLGNLPAALDSYGKALSQFHSSALAVFPHRSLLVAFGLVSVARVLAKLHKSDEARMNYQEGLHLAETAATTNPPNALAQYVLIDAYAGMGNLSLQTVNTGDQRRNSRSEACKWYQKNMDIWQTLPVRTAITPNGFKVTEYEAIAGQLAKCAQ